MRPNLENVLPRMAGSFSGNLRVDAVWLYQCEAGQDAECREYSAFDAKEQGSATYIKDRPKAGRWVFPGPGNSGHLVSVQKSHLRAVNKAGLERFPFYCWRHTFGTRCAESGMDRNTLAKLMGHSSPRITEKYYIHVTEPHTSSGFERFMAHQAKRMSSATQTIFT